MSAPLVIRTIAELQAYADAERAAGRRLGLVPTMGALHAGHLSLIDEARKHAADRIIVSIFVNPTQFGPGEDYEAYPRTWQTDLASCEEFGVDVVFAPKSDEMYFDDEKTRVSVSDLTGSLCGASRPGHFDGVTTVVTKLFLAARPHLAVFGEKDFQQLAVLRRMARDLNFGIEIIGAPIVRNADGLALSSRNQYLDAEARRQALVLSRAIAVAEGAVSAGEHKREVLLYLVNQEIEKAPLAEIDYVELRDSNSLEPAREEIDGPTLLALAVRFQVEGTGPESVRLIDNTVLQPNCNTEE